MGEVAKFERHPDMDVWNQLRTPDKKFVKKIPGGSGLSAVDAQYVIRRLTEAFGLQGREWGLRDVAWRIEPTKGRLGNRKTGYKEYDTQTFFLEATFYYPGGEIPMVVDEEFWSGQDIAKKSRTSLLSKSASQIGAMADVFLGCFDDQGLVEKGQFNALPEEDKYAKVLDGIARAATAEKLDAVLSHVEVYYKDGMLTKAMAAELREIIAARRSEFAKD